ncbi:MAG: hypothetical protein KIT87_09755 [Anaerolineae bacterium]|nr:hypothetical protein [Anaerolineae bacterium]
MEGQASASIPWWRENLLFILFEWLALRLSLVFYGIGVPRGDGAPVVLIPGYLTNDWSLLEMFHWLRRMGYRPYVSHIGWNCDCFDVLVDRLLETIEQANAETGRKVALIGQSLGGVFARSAATRRPELVSCVITLGSPFRGFLTNPFVQWAAGLTRAFVLWRRRPHVAAGCCTLDCPCKTVAALHAPFPSTVPQHAVYSKTDGVVDWRTCINDDPATNVEVHGTHIGMGLNRATYRFIASELARVTRPSRETSARRG